LANYAVPPELLRPRLPRGLELDAYDGQTFVSLVAFDFLDTRVAGVAWPGFRNFPELNLRYYVRRGKQRGVVFIREFVPQRAVALLARLLYNEPYAAASMMSNVNVDDDTITATRALTWGGRIHTLRVIGRSPAYRPAPDSMEHFFKEHQWGYGVSRLGRAVRYEVRHPEWDVYPVGSHQIDLDWQAVYGPEWSCLQGAEPSSTVFAVGSTVAVYPKA
jgi:uncharacterized protein YqjF (DUF2071 family)